MVVLKRLGLAISSGRATTSAVKWQRFDAVVWSVSILTKMMIAVLLLSSSWLVRVAVRFSLDASEANELNEEMRIVTRAKPRVLGGYLQSMDEGDACTEAIRDHLLLHMK